MTTAETASQKTFFGHPRGLATLFFTEMWERFSYYGMRALLILFMTAPIAAGGLEFDVATAGAIYGLYTALVYMTGLPGGWIADHLLGQRKSVLVGGIIIACGHFTMAFHGLGFFFTGLILIIIGTGLLKTNVSAMVGELYSGEDTRRDSGFSIFYMGINLGASISPFICGYLGQKIDWHYGFAAAGVGMVFGLIQYVIGGKYLGNAGMLVKSEMDADVHRRSKRFATMIGAGIIVVVGLLYFLINAGTLNFTLKQISTGFGSLIVILPLAYFISVFTKKGWDTVERKRIAVIAILFLFSSMFWAAYEQAGSTLNLFAERFTANTMFSFDFPSSWLQSVASIFVIALAPVFAFLWIKLGKYEPSSPTKFALGLFFVGLGFLLMVGAAMVSGPGGMRVSPTWLITVYFLHTVGEICLYPVGLSTVTKLAPQRIAGQLMGIWFLTISLGNFIGGQIAGLFESMPLTSIFGGVVATTWIAALILVVLTKTIRRLMGGIH